MQPLIGSPSSWGGKICNRHDLIALRYIGSTTRSRLSGRTRDDELRSALQSEDACSVQAGVWLLIPVDTTTLLHRFIPCYTCEPLWKARTHIRTLAACLDASACALAAC